MSSAGGRLDGRVRRVCVVGAGAAGLAAVKSMLADEAARDTPPEVVCYEKAASVGGLWHFTEEPKPAQATIARSTFSNTSKMFLNFSDFPMPDDGPHFPPHQKVAQYLEDYARHFDLLRRIRFRHRVVSVGQADDFAATGAWTVTVKDESSGEMSVERFDAVMVCSGLHRTPTMPELAGMESFTGRVLHSHEYTGPSDAYRDQTVVVVGFGDAAIRTAVDLSHVASKVYLSTREGNWVLPLRGPGGLPYDHHIYSRFGNFWQQHPLGGDGAAEELEAFCSARLSHRLYGIKPSWRATQTHPPVSDALAGRLLTGAVQTRPAVAALVAPRGVEFTDGATLDHVDTVILATGYTTEFPFLDKKLGIMSGHELNLYKFVFPTTLEHTTLAVIGCVRVIGAHFPTFELQARWAARVFLGGCRLPDRSKMAACVRAQHQRQRETYAGNARHHATVSGIVYNDDIADEIGCKPDPMSLALRGEAALSRAVWAGPSLPAHYRLVGPGRWDGASTLILDTARQIEKPFGRW